MQHYVLGDVITEISERENNPSHSEYERFVGLEHYVSGEVEIENYGSTANLNSAMKVFNSGDILVARRNVYLKRASVVYFDGLTSGDSIVLRPKNETIGRILPFVLNTDDFWDYADQYSDGTMSKRLSPKVLKQYEFDLPDDDLEQLADILWAMADVKKSYQRLLKQTDELMKSQFIEWFGDPVWNTLNLPISTIGQETECIVSGQCLNGSPGVLRQGEKAVLKVSAVTYGYFKEDEYKVLYDVNQVSKGIYPMKGDLLFSRANTREYVGATALIDKDYPNLFLPDKLWKLVFKETIHPVFAKHFLSHPSVRKVLSEIATGTSGSMYNISMDKLRALKITVPSLSVQEQFVEFARQSDKSKFELKQAIEGVNLLIKSMIQQEFN